MDIRSSLIINSAFYTFLQFFRSLYQFNHRIIIVMKYNYIKRISICFLSNVGSV